MTIHLHEVRSSDQLARAWSYNRLDFCLLVLKHLERSYPAATIVHELFVHARDKNSVPFGISHGRHTTQSNHDQNRDDIGARNPQHDHTSLGTDLASSDPGAQQPQFSDNMMDDAMASLYVDDGTWSLFPLEYDAF